MTSSDPSGDSHIRPDEDRTVVVPPPFSTKGEGEPAFRGNRYRLKRILGRGGMGVVWLAEDAILEIEVALKVVHPELQADPVALRELREETRKGIRLAHPNIVRIYDFVDDEQSAAISMEYVDGSTLADLRAARPNLVFTAEELAPWLLQACDALDYAHHQQRIVHRDIKPANIMITSSGHVKIADFGIARQIVDATIHMASPNTVTSGTLAYMSPQQLLGGRPRPADDVYSLGATLYDLLSGKPPFFRGDIAAQLATVVPPSIKDRRIELGVTGADDVPRLWEELIAACLQKDPADRPQTVSEIVDRLRLREGALPQDVGEPSPGQGNRRRVAWMAAAVVAVMAGVVAIGSRNQGAKSDQSGPSSAPGEPEEPAPINEKTVTTTPPTQAAQTEAVRAEESKRTTEWKVIQYDNVDYVTAENLRDFYRFKTLEIRGDEVWLRSPTLILKATIRRDEMLVNNIKFVLSHPVVSKDRQALFSRVDLVKLIDPILRPSFIHNAPEVETVVIDPAYGGEDIGSFGVYGRAKEWTLKLALALKAEAQRRGFKAVLTRSTDVLVSQGDRVAIANKEPNSVFISLQFGSSPDRGAGGIETFALNVQDSVNPVATGNRNDSGNIALATALHAGVVSRFGAQDRGIRRAQSEVLAGCRHPGVIMVLGYLSNPQEARLIASESYQQQVAKALADALVSYRKAVKPQSRATKPDGGSQK